MHSFKSNKLKYLDFWYNKSLDSIFYEVTKKPKMFYILFK